MGSCAERRLPRIAMSDAAQELGLLVALGDAALNVAQARRGTDVALVTSSHRLSRAKTRW